MKRSTAPPHAGNIPKVSLLLICLLTAFTFSTYAQTKRISGTVTGPDNTPLEGVTVREKSSSRSTTTSASGTFNLDVSQGASILVFSYTGMASQEVDVAGEENIQIQLQANNTALSEVVVIGYGTARKRDITGAVGSVKGKDLRATTAADASALLQGRVAGVVIQNGGGAPGAAPSVVIRGSGTFGNDQPLYIVDGMITNSMASINPNDIESIEVLKDASAAAIYGSRAANGVVLITTKGGSAGGVKVEFNAKYGTQSPTRKLKFLDARQYADWNNMARDNDGQPHAPGNSTAFNPNINTDWQSLSLGSAPIGDYNLSLSGGGQQSRYFISGRYFNQKGIVVDSWFKNYSLRANSSFTKGKFRLTEALSVSRTINNPNTYFGRERAELPTMPVYDSTKNGGFGGLEPAFAGVPRVINWYGLAMLNDNRFTTDQVLGNIGAEYEILKGLKYKLNAGIDYSVFHSYDFTPSFFFSSSQEAFNDQARLSEGITRGLNTLIEHTLNYNKSFGGHHFDLLAGGTNQKGSARSLGVRATKFPSNDLRVVNAALDRTVNSTGDLQEFVLQSVLGRLSYNYESKYLFSATFRRDGSSRFLYGKNTYGNFPSFSAGWRVSEEKFFPKNDFISDLKIRGSYGTLGSQNIGNYLTSSTLNIYTDYYFAGGVQPGVALTNFANPNLVWESTKTKDIGVDVSLLRNRLQITADYFNKLSYDIHANIPIPIYGGVGRTLLKNAATISNKGLEMSATYNNLPLSKDGLKYSVTGVFTTIKNNVESLGSGVNPIVGGSFTQESLVATRTDVGHPIGSFWGYQVLGIYQSADEVTKDGRTDARPGDLRFSKDPTWLGSPFPKFEYGTTINASYKNFDLNLFVQGVYGNKIWNAKRAWQYIFDYGSNKVTDVLRAWTPANTNTDIPRATLLDPANNKRSSSFYVEDGSYLRLKNISVGYTLPATLLKQVNITHAHVYLSAQNILTFTKYKGYDPEVGRNSSTPYTGGMFGAGVDVSAYPQAKMISAGIDLSF